MVYCIRTTGVLYAIDANTGLELWSTFSLPEHLGLGPAPASQDQPLIREGIIFANSWSDGDLILFDQATGEELERHKDEKYSGENIVYDEETDLYYVTTYGKIKAFKLRR